VREAAREANETRRRAAVDEAASEEARRMEERGRERGERKRMGGAEEESRAAGRVWKKQGKKEARAKAKARQQAEEDAAAVAVACSGVGAEGPAAWSLAPHDEGSRLYAPRAAASPAVAATSPEDPEEAALEYARAESCALSEAREWRAPWAEPCAAGPTDWAAAFQPRPTAEALGQWAAPPVSQPPLGMAPDASELPLPSYGSASHPWPVASSFASGLRHGSSDLPSVGGLGALPADAAPWVPPWQARQRWNSGGSGLPEDHLALEALLMQGAAAESAQTDPLPGHPSVFW
jgi:hypothetical protein